MSAVALQKRLASLTDTAQSIETISEYILFRRRDASDLASTWLEVFRSEGSDHKRKRLLLLLAEVIAKCHERSFTELQDFASTVAGAAELCLPESTLLWAALCKLCKLWESKHTLPQTLTRSIRAHITKQENSVAAQQLATDRLHAARQHPLYQHHQKRGSRRLHTDLQSRLGTAHETDYSKLHQQLTDTEAASLKLHFSTAAYERAVSQLELLYASDPATDAALSAGAGALDDAVVVEGSNRMIEERPARLREQQDQHETAIAMLESLQAKMQAEVEGGSGGAEVGAVRAQLLEAMRHMEELSRRL